VTLLSKCLFSNISSSLLDIRQPLFQPGDVTQAQIVHRFSFAFERNQALQTNKESIFFSFRNQKKSINRKKWFEHASIKSIPMMVCSVQTGHGGQQMDGVHRFHKEQAAHWYLLVTLSLTKRPYEKYGITAVADSVRRG
jgi:hypothetical protein